MDVTRAKEKAQKKCCTMGNSFVSKPPTHCKYCNTALKGQHTLLECRKVLGNTALLVYNEERRLIDHNELLKVIYRVDTAIETFAEYARVPPPSSVTK